MKVREIRTQIHEKANTKLDGKNLGCTRALCFIMLICQALPNRTTWHLNATDYLKEIGVVDLHLNTDINFYKCSFAYRAFGY